jgi:23S rRNA (cytidine2498-2'-O)-methyltransferase
MIESPDLVVISPRGLDEVIEDELGDRVFARFDRLFLIRGRSPVYFAQNLWLEPETVRFKSISQAAKVLRDIQRNWWLHSTQFHRRAKLIAEQLPTIKRKSFPFPMQTPTQPMGGWTLLDESTLLYSARCSSPFPDGENEFAENKSDPPSRAYLKLWETFSLLGVTPKVGQKVLDLGSSPGGWTWVLSTLGCDVTSVDKAPLADSVRMLKNVKYVDESAFALASNPGFDWLFSDVICYPERLLELVRKWEPLVPNMICTIKFQGQTNFAVIAEFLKVKGFGLVHLTNNKHELTWYRISAP